MSSLPVLIFDGDCAFCSSCVRTAQRLLGRMPEVQPYQLEGDEGLAALGLTAEQCRQAVQYVARDRQVYAAHDAVSALLLAAGKGWWLLGALLRVPGVHWLSGVAYRWVARHRHRLPGGTAACALPRT
ncbi:MAG: DUF393 domain-containing protein [Actinomycetota bacterium]|nr:DUF393 domain-containing protein [Actinomycetota bacterium]